jgi:hypothetical protein
MVSALARISADCVWPCLDVYPGPAALFARFESLIEGRAADRRFAFENDGALEFRAAAKLDILLKKIHVHVGEINRAKGLTSVVT